MKRTAWTLVFALGFLCLAFAFAADSQGAEPKKPFDGISLKGWKAVNPNAKSCWMVGRAMASRRDASVMTALPLEKKDKKFVEGALINLVEPNWQEEPRGSVDFYCEQKFGDCVVDLEFMVAKGSNSGIYLMGEYEVQVLDSWGRETMGPGDVGALYGAAPPKVNASLEPGTWQHIVIDFQAPKFDADGKKTQNAKFVKITLNGKVVQENVEMKEQTPGGITGKEAPTGPLMFQGNHGPVAFRNIQVFEK